MTVPSAFGSAGRRRSPATMPGYHAGRPPRNKGMRYPADPPTVEEIVAEKGGRRREVGMDEWGWEHLRPWLAQGPNFPAGPCSASSTAPRTGDRGQAPRSARLVAHLSLQL
jgi:hypothetical protein